MTIKNQKIIEAREIPGTPFTAVYNGDAWILCIGNSQAVRHTWQHAEDIVDYINKPDWELCVALAICINKLPNKEVTNEPT